MDINYIGAYAGITVMLPTALVLGFWLWAAGSRRLALYWAMSLAAAYAVVGGSKLLFKGWGIGLGSLDIAVFSGHAMHACLVLPVALSLLARQCAGALRWPAAVLGLVLAWLISAFIVAPLVHPLPEAIAGALVGSLAGLAFLFAAESRPVLRIPPFALIQGALVILLVAVQPKYNAEALLNSLATTLSGAEAAFLKPHWRQ